MSPSGIRWNSMIRSRLSAMRLEVILVIGLVLRESLSFWTGHPYDSEVWIRNAVYVSRGISPYSFMNPIPGLSFAFLNQTLPSVGYPPLWSLLLAGLYRLFAILLNLFPLIFVPYYIIRDRGTTKLRQIVTLGIPAAFTAASFLLGGWGIDPFQGTLVYGARGVPLGMTILGVVFSPDLLSIFPGIEPAFAVVGWLWVPAVVVAGILAARRFSRETPQGLVQAMLSVTVGFFLSLLQVYEQYLLYLLPPLLLDVTLWHPERAGLFRLTWILGLGYLLFNNDFLLRFVIPVFPAAEQYSYALDNNSAFGPMRGIVLMVLAVSFAIHLVQLGFVLMDERRNPKPWFVRAVQWLAGAKRAAEEVGGPRAGDSPR